MGDVTQLVCSLHGVGIGAIGSATVISALASRLGELPQDETQPSIMFEYEMAGAGGEHAIEKPKGNGRPFYVPLFGEAIYYPDGDILYMSYGDQARVLCRASEGRCRISLAEPECERVWLGTHPLFTIPLIEMLKRKGLYSLHAAAFALEGRCVLLAGTSGAGKSTLTVCHLRAGLSFMGDDMTFFSEVNGTQALAFPERIDITDTTASFFPELKEIADSQRRSGWPKHEIRATDFFPNNLTWSAAPAAIIFPQISNLKESQLSAIGANEAFLELVPNVLLTDPVATKEHVAFISRLVQETPAYRLHAARDFNRITDIVTEILKTTSA
jgi:ABC-type iron transport system FetAB ATPase subunit